jgi:hypothetical protein
VLARPSELSIIAFQHADFGAIRFVYFVLGAVGLAVLENDLRRNP